MDDGDEVLALKLNCDAGQDEDDEKGKAVGFDELADPFTTRLAVLLDVVDSANDDEEEDDDEARAEKSQDRADTVRILLFVVVAVTAEDTF